MLATAVSESAANGVHKQNMGSLLLGSKAELMHKYGSLQQSEALRFTSNSKALVLSTPAKRTPDSQEQPEYSDKDQPFKGALKPL